MTTDRCFMNLYRAEVRYYAKGGKQMNIAEPMYSFMPIPAGRRFDAEGRGSERDAATERFGVLQVPGTAKIIEGTSGYFIRVEPPNGPRMDLSADHALSLARARQRGFALVGQR